MTAPTDAVTTVVRRKVRAGRETEYEAWLERLAKGVAKQFDGYLGAEFHRPASLGDAYRSVFRFATLENLEEFERSEFRAQMLANAAPIFAADPVSVRMTGLEFWFDPPPGTRAAQASTHRMALVLVGVVFCLVLSLNLAVGPFIADWPLAARILLTVVIQVGLMTYVVMPWLTPKIARFIYPTTQIL